MVAVSSRQNKT